MVNANWWSDPLFGLGLLVMMVGLLLITIDVVVIPTIILTLVSLAGWFIFLIYVYGTNPDLALVLGGFSILLGVMYGVIIYKFKFWRFIAHEKKVPMEEKNWEEIIATLNQKTVVALTDLRPVGKIKIAEETHDGLSEEGFIASGTLLQINNYAEGQYRVVKK